ncbi:ABC transporter ATP-binding protein [Natronorarus salvus]|uniref:ABC transporter ATP-binding protein n=1 Tax=Natronorarus salvus TaxID=3117733 RepID=UPI002F25F4CD
MSETLLEVRDLKTQFYTERGAVRAVDGVSFDVKRGEIVGLVGESGAGKSVTTSSIMRLVEEPGEVIDGEVSYRDRTLVGFEQSGAEGADGRPELVPRDEMLSNREMREEIRGNEIAIIFQDPMESLNPVYTVGGQIREFIELNRGMSTEEAREEAIEMLRRVGIPEAEDRYDDYPHEFSGGMRQRVLIAMALGCRPNLIIADEPTTALDVTVEGQILELVSELVDEFDTSFIWVTHDMGVVAEICDRVNVMYLGRIVEQGPVDDIFHDTKHPYTEALLRSIPRPDQTVSDLVPIEGTMPGAMNPPAGCRFHPRCPDAREACREIEPELYDVGPDHRSACIKHADVGYWESEPLPGREAEPVEGRQ